ncbi:MAG: SDR family NAD(P)-dependent oxidoreductase [Pseudomonadota bacterium]
MTGHNVVDDVLERVRFLTAESLDGLADKVREGEKPAKLGSLRDVAALTADSWRLAVTGDDDEAVGERMNKLRAAVEKGLDEKKISFLRRQGIFISGTIFSGVGFLYPGQGSQSINMLGELMRRYGAFADTVRKADGVMEPLLGRPLSSFVYTDLPDDAPGREKMEEQLRQTEITQPAMLAMDMALTELLAQLGIYPDYVTGHSLGEYAALVSAKILRLEDTLEIVAARGKEMTSVSIDDPGRMIAVMAGAEETEEAIAKIDGYLIAANKNSNRQTVVAGSSEAIGKAVDALEGQGLRTVPLRVSHAFHSRIVAGAIEPLGKVLGRFEFSKPAVPVFTNVTGEAYPMDADKEHFIDILSRQIASPVEFIKCMKSMHEAGARFFVEVGPRKVLASFADDVLPRGEIMVTCANNHRQGDLESLANLFAAAAVAGVVREGEPERRIGGAGDAGGAGEKADEGPAQNPQAEPAGARAGSGGLLQEILNLVSEKSGYPVDMLDPDMDMEADLGIDTVKQAEFFSIIRKKYDIPKQENLKLKDYPTISHVAGFVSRFVDAGKESGAAGPRKESGAAGPRPAQDSDGAKETPSKEPVERPEHEERKPAAVLRETPRDAILISGASLGLPGKKRKLFDDENFRHIFEGRNFIEPIERELQEKFLDLNMVKIDKGTGDELIQKEVSETADVIKLAGQVGEFDLVSDYGVDSDFSAAMDDTARMAAAAGYEALRDAGIPLVLEMKKTTTGAKIPVGWFLPPGMRADTGVIFGSCFPGFNRFAQELEKFYRHKLLGEPYSFDRKILFGILPMGHTHFAQLIRARGPNLQVNAACASALIGMATAVDWIRAGRCKRVIVITADNTSSDSMLPWVGGGFLSSGGAAIDANVEDAAIPFDRRRHGLIVGAGAAAVLLEAEDEVRARGMNGLARVVHTQMSNSAYHGTRLDGKHIAGEMQRFVADAARISGCGADELADGLVFLSHETYTPARGGSASAEVGALRKAFGANTSKILVSNTKGFTGHPMGVGFEESVAPYILHEQEAPPVANVSQTDPEFSDLRLSRGGPVEAKRVLRYAAGFGSQLAMALLERASESRERVVDQGARKAWLEAVGGGSGAGLFMDGKVLKAARGFSPADSPADSNAALKGRTAENTGEESGGAGDRRPAQPMDMEKILVEVTRLIGEKSGYPVDMLEPDMDMEADLGIDTVKQAELISLVRKKYGIAKVDNLKLKDYPTINHVVKFIAQHKGNDHAGGDSPADKKGGVRGFSPADSDPAEKVDDSLYGTVEAFTATMKKPVLRWMPAASSCPPTSVSLEKGDAVIIHGMGKFRLELEHALTKMNVRVIDAESAAMEGTGLPVKGIIFFEDMKLCRVPSLEDLPFHGEIVVNEAVRRLEVFKKAGEGGFETERGFVIGITFHGGGRALSQSEGSSISSGALTGFIKALAFELPGCVVKTIDFGDDQEGQRSAAAVMDEIRFDPASREVGVYRESRWTVDLEGVDIPAAPQPSTAARQERAVYLVTGAGGSVMGDAIRKIACSRASDFVLLDIVKPEVTEDRTWSKAFARIMGLIEYVERKGGSALYVTSDVTDTDSVAGAVKSALARYGKIDTVIHGAGIERSRSALKKTSDEFRTVVSIKVMGAVNLLAAFAGKSQPGKFVFFSSVAGRFGNAGQTDYAAGNDFMAKLASCAGRVAPDSEMLTVDWTAWDGEGMAGNESIKILLEEAGVEMLGRREGVDILWRLLGARGLPPEIVVSKKLGVLEDMVGAAGRIEVGPSSGESKDSFRIRRGGSSLRVTVSPVSEAWLWDHAVDGTPVFPAVKGMELFHHACLETIGDAGWHLTGIRNAGFMRAVKFFSGRERELRVEAAVNRADGSMLACGCRLLTETPGRLSPGSVTNFKADLLFDFSSNGHNGNGRRRSDVLITRSDGIEMLGRSAGWDEGSAINRDDIYRLLFHGGQFQVVESFMLGSARDDCGLGRMSAAVRGDLKGVYLLCEFGMQAAGLYLLRTAGIAGLPLGIKSMNIMPVSGNESYRAVVVYRGTRKLSEEQFSYSFDVSVRNQYGEPALWIDGLELVGTGMVEEARAAVRRLPWTGASESGVREA